MRIRMLVLASVFMTAACSGSSTAPSGSSPGGNSGGGNSGGASTLTATIDGAAWRPGSVTARLGANGTYVEVDTTDSALDLFSFAAGPVNGPVGVGTFQIGSSPTNANYVLPGGATIWTAASGRGSGSVTITSFSSGGKTASGTFNFVLVNGSGNTKTVTNGQFNVSF